MMVNVQSGNIKLNHRAAEIVAKIAGVELQKAALALDKSQEKVKPAVLLCAGAPDFAAAQLLLEDVDIYGLATLVPAPMVSICGRVVRRWGLVGNIGIRNIGQMYGASKHKHQNLESSELWN